MAQLINRETETRKQWLGRAIEMMRREFTAAGAPLPENLAVSCSWPSGNPRTVIGECWVAEASIEAELAEREAEWPLCRYKLARLGGEGVAILGHYTGKDQMVFNLAKRLPFHHRGIAHSMLARWSEEGGEHRVRSLLINCGVGGPAEALYRRLGFTDVGDLTLKLVEAPPSRYGGPREARSSNHADDRGRYRARTRRRAAHRRHALGAFRLSGATPQ